MQNNLFDRVVWIFNGLKTGILFITKKNNLCNNVRVKITASPGDTNTKELTAMGKIITNKTVQILVLQALIAVLIAIYSMKTAHAAPYTVFGFDNNARVAGMTNSIAARATFDASVSDAVTNDLESYTTGRNMLFAEPIPLLGTRDIQYGISFSLGGNTIFARSSRITQTYLALDLSATNPQYDDAIVVADNGAFSAPPVSGTKFMGGTCDANKPLFFDFATTANTGNATGVNAFGFYGIDAGDTALNNLSVDVTYNDNTVQNFAILPGGFGSTANDNTFFFGFVSPDQGFKSVRINNPQSGTDSVGYDDFVIGRNVSAVAVPEAPLFTGLLLGCSLLGGLAITRRKNAG